MDPRPKQDTIFGADIPFARLCGVEALDYVGGHTRLRLALRAEHGNNLGIAHGGVICTLLDIAMGTAARLAVGRPVLTLDMQTRFLAPGSGVLLAEGFVVRGGRSVLFCEAEIRGEGGDRIATASGLFKPARSEGPPSVPSAGMEAGSGKESTL